VEQAIMAAARTGDTGIDRPWHWLVAVAREAQRRGEHELVAHLALFVGMWMTSFVPRLTLGDCQDMRLSSPPAARLGEIYSVALVEVPKLDPTTIVVDHPTGRITVEGLLRMCAVGALELQRGLVEPQALARAQTVIG